MKSSKLLAALTASVLLISPTFAAETANAPLPAGKPAGTKEAALLALGPIFWIGLAAIAIGITAAAGGFNSSSSTGTSS